LRWEATEADVARNLPDESAAGFVEAICPDFWPAGMPQVTAWPTGQVVPYAAGSGGSPGSGG
jgi:hypothetical protein